MKSKIIASAAALSLAAGLVACSNEETGADATSVVSETATATASETVTTPATTETEASTATATVTSSAASASSSAAAPAATEELALADGATALVPQGVIETIDKYADASWGQPTAAEEIDGGWVVSFDGEHYITWKESTGGAPIWGEIANSWLNDVRGARVVGFPKMPETPNTDQSGWNQEFENGTIEWTRDGGADAAFRAFVEEKGNK